LHHQHNNYPQYISSPQQPGPSYPYSPQGYPVGNPDRLSHQSSLSAGYASQPYPLHNPPSTSAIAGQTYYPSQMSSQSSYNPHTSYPQYTPSYHGGFSPSLAPPLNPALGRARSMNNHSNPLDSYNSAHFDLNNSPNSVGYSARPPSQAFHSQVPHPNGPREFLPAPLSQRQKGGSLLPPEVPPKISLSLEHEEGGLGGNFVNTNNSFSEFELDDDGSELPWASGDSSSV
jgi:hypothetical protein